MKKVFHFFAKFMLCTVLSCVVVLIVSSDAKAMTLEDLQGDYRIIEEGDTLHTWGVHSDGSIVTLSYENDDLAGRVKKPSKGCGFVAGDQFLSDVYVDNGTAYCQFSALPGFTKNSVINIYNHGATIRIQAREAKGYFWVLKRL